MEGKKEKVVNFGLTEELMNYLNDLTERSFNKAEEKDEKPGLGVKRVIAEMAKKEAEKIQKELDKDDLSRDEWFDLMHKLDQISDLVKWY